MIQRMIQRRRLRRQRDHTHQRFFMAHGLGYSEAIIRHTHGLSLHTHRVYGGFSRTGPNFAPGGEWK